MAPHIVHSQADGLKLLASSKRSPRVETGARLIAVTSGKGGVGKTNLVVNLGLCLVEMGLRVAILDADMGLANVDILIGQVPQYNLSHVLLGDKRLEEIIIDGPRGLKVLAGGSGITELADLSQWKLEQFLLSLRALDSMFDIILVDTGAGISRTVLGFVLSATEVVVMTTPDPTAITDAYGIIKIIANKSPDTRMGVVVNMVEGAKQASNVYEKLRMVVQRFLGLELLYYGFIPDESIVREAVRRQVPFYMAYPRSKASHSIRQVAHTVTGMKPEKPGGAGQFFSRMARLFRS